MDLFSYLGIERTRRSAINLNYLGDIPEPYSILDELELPEDLQRLDLFEIRDGKFKLRRG